MNDILVSVRMPSSMLLKLKELVKKEHFMDLSDEIRSITRKRWLAFKNPELVEIKNLRKDILKEVRKKSENEIRKKVINELNEIKKDLKKEGAR